MNTTRYDPPTPRARVVARVAQRREQERAARWKEKRIWQRERREQESRRGSLPR
jgi:hypothetical protein